MIPLHEVSEKLVEDKEFIIANLNQYITGNLVFNMHTALPCNVKEKVISLEKVKDKFKLACCNSF